MLIEGIARELVRTVQDARKSADLEISDRILLTITGSNLVQEALATYRDYIMSETLALELNQNPVQGFNAQRTLEEQSWEITLAKQL